MSANTYDLPDIPFITTSKEELSRIPLQTLRMQYLQTLHNHETQRAYGRDISAFLKYLDLEHGNLEDLEKRGLPDLYGSLYEFLQSYLYIGLTIVLHSYSATLTYLIAKIGVTI